MQATAVASYVGSYDPRTVMRGGLRLHSIPRSETFQTVQVPRITAITIPENCFHPFFLLLLWLYQWTCKVIRMA